MTTAQHVSLETSQLLPRDRLYGVALARVREEWGPNVRHKLGDALYEALLAQQILYLISGQDSDVSDAVVRRLTDNALEFITIQLNGGGE